MELFIMLPSPVPCYIFLSSSFCLNLRDKYLHVWEKNKKNYNSLLINFNLCGQQNGRKETLDRKVAGVLWVQSISNLVVLFINTRNILS